MKEIKQKFSGGDHIEINFNIQSGVSRAELLGLLPMMKEQIINAVADRRLRGGSFARSMGR